MVDDPDHTKPKRDTSELDDAILEWIAGGKSADAHGCPACPHSAFGGSMGSGNHILIDGTVFTGGAISGKIGSR